MTIAGETAIIEALAGAIQSCAGSQGAGAQLAEALIGWARGEGYRAVLLDVVEGNTQALELYDWLGFRRSGIRRSRLTKAIYGFRTCHEMTLPL